MCKEFDVIPLTFINWAQDINTELAREGGELPHPWHQIPGIQPDRRNTGKSTNTRTSSYIY